MPALHVLKVPSCWMRAPPILCSRCAPLFCDCPGESHLGVFGALPHVCAQVLVFPPSVEFCEDCSITRVVVAGAMVKLRH